MPTFDSSAPGAPRLYFESRGEGAPMVLLNGMSQSTANWMSQARALSASWRVVSYDARGQGRSDVGGDAPATLDAHAADLLALLDHLEIEAATLVGFSHGARVALAFAARHPERVEAMVLTSAGAARDALRDLMIRAWAEILALGGVEAMAWCALPDILGRAFMEQQGAHVEAMVRATAQRNTAEGLGRLLTGLRAYPDAAVDAAGVRCPTLVISASEDRLVSSASTRALVGALSGAAMVDHVEIGDCGHTVPIERPEAWRSAVEAFAARVVGGR